MECSSGGPAPTSPLTTTTGEAGTCSMTPTSKTAQCSKRCSRRRKLLAILFCDEAVTGERRLAEDCRPPLGEPARPVTPDESRGTSGSPRAPARHPPSSAPLTPGHPRLSLPCTPPPQPYPALAR